MGHVIIQPVYLVKSNKIGCWLRYYQSFFLSARKVLIRCDGLNYQMRVPWKTNFLTLKYYLFY